MKRIVFSAIIMVGLVLSAIGSSAQAIKRKSVMGTWTLTEITYDNVKAYSDIKVFGDVDAACMINSTWVFFGNWNATITSPAAAECSTVPQKGVWSTVEKEGGQFFGFKPVLSGQKAGKLKTGFLMPIQSFDENNMVWTETVDLGYKKAQVTYHFTKISKKAK